MSTQKITPFLWFNNEAEEAVKFYCSVFKDAKMLKVARYPEGTPGIAGTVMTIHFLLNGQEFVALNGGPHFKFTEAISFMVNCETQEEIDFFWEKLSGDGGQEVECGWLKDKYNLSWQIVPASLSDMMTDEDPDRSGRVMHALLKMKKPDINKLNYAFNNKK